MSRSVATDGLVPTSTLAQESGGCTLLCRPELAFEPTWTVENFAAAPRVVELEGGVPVDTVQTGTETAFELVFALDVPTEIPRTSFTFEAIWTPFAGTSGNPFTGRSAEELGVSAVDDNPVELEAEANVALITPEETGGWVDAHFDVVDQLSPAEQPEDTRLFTHKLDLELDAAIVPLNFLAEGSWLRNLELEGSLDYMVTGIPRAGDEVPEGEQRFLDDASPWSVGVLAVVPLAPLSL